MIIIDLSMISVVKVESVSVCLTEGDSSDDDGFEYDFSSISR